MRRNGYGTVLSRRGLLRGATVAGAGIAGAALIGCAEDDGDNGSTATPGAGSGATATPGGSPSATEPRRGGIYKTFTTGDPPTLDPYGNASTGTKSFAAYVYSRLFRVNAQPGVDVYEAEVIPDVAENVETSDSQSWVISLKQGVKFQDLAPVSGRELTSEDVMFSWQRLTAEDSPNRSQVSNIVNVEAVDDYTVKFDLDAPSPIFMDQMSDANLLWIMPVESDGGFDPKTQPIGSGPWIMEAYEASARLNFAANPDWHPGAPYLDGVDEYIIPEYANRMSQFQAGNLHSFTVTSDDVPGLKTQSPEVQWLPIPGGSLNFIYFSPEDREPDAPWRDERFRRAISMSIDRDGIMELGYNLEAIREVGLDYPVRWNNIMPAAFGPRWWLDPQSEEQGESAAYFQYNPDEAMKLLDAVGVPDAPITYQYTNNRYGPGFSTLAEAVFNWLQLVGLPVQTETQDYNSVYITQTFRGNFDGMTLGVSTPFGDPSAYIDRFFGDDPANHGRVHDPEITELHNKQRVELDEDARRGYVHDVQRRNGEMMWYVPVQPSGGAVWIAYQPEVQGIRRTRSYGGATEVTAQYWLDA